jgi:hypothetical protein
VSSTSDDVFTRLSLVIEDWNAQIVRSHEELTAQIGVARGHLDRLLQPSTPGEAAELEEALALAREELAERAAAKESLELELREAATEIESLATALEEARAAGTAQPTDPGDVDTLRSALELLQLEHAQAQDQIRMLRDALDRAAQGEATTPRRTGIEAFDERGHKKRMGEILVELGLLTEVQLKSVLKEQAADPHRRLGQLLVDHGFTGEDVVAKIVAAQLRLPYQDIVDTDVEPGAVAAVSPHVVRLHRCLPLGLKDGVLTVAMVNPLDLIAIEDIELASRCRVSPVVSTPSNIDDLIGLFYPDQD